MFIVLIVLRDREASFFGHAHFAFYPQNCFDLGFHLDPAIVLVYYLEPRLVYFANFFLCRVRAEEIPHFLRQGGYRWFPSVGCLSLCENPLL